MPRATPENALFRGGALHPGERRCAHCSGRIGDTEQCKMIHEDRADRVSTFAHLQCPSPPLSGHGELAHAWEEASATLRLARSWYQLLGKRKEKSPWLNDLISAGKRLHEAIEREERLVAASLVLGLRQWSRLAGVLEGSSPQKKKKPYASTKAKTPSSKA